MNLNYGATNGSPISMVMNGGNIVSFTSNDGKATTLGPLTAVILSLAAIVSTFATEHVWQSIGILAKFNGTNTSVVNGIRLDFLVR